MGELLEILSAEWAIRALVTSSIVGITCGIIGCYIVLKNMSLIGDALSHSILPGIYFAYIIVGYSTLGFFMGSVLAGVFTAVIITWIQTNIKTKNDAAIGIVFTAMFALGVIGISSLNNQQGNHLDLKDFLFGNVLGISNQDIVLSIMVLIFTVTSITLFYRHFLASTFQPVIAETMGISTKTIHYFLMVMLSFAVVAALQSVGVILVVAMLITPASTALLLSHRLSKVILISGSIGLLSAICGIILSITYNLPPGPAIVLIATCFYIIAALFAPHKGLVQQQIYKVAQKRKILQEDILKYLSKTPESSSVLEISNYLSTKERHVKAAISKLRSEGLLDFNKNVINLSSKGRQYATELVRAHRLWESYQVNKMGMQQDQIHEDAERLEHHLTPELLDDIDERLGYPATDPHGSPIPQKQKLPPKPLISLKPKSKGTISKNQLNDHIESELWELGILPESSFVLQKMLQDGVVIKINSKTFTIEENLAKMVNVET